jgi:hypothetical protein
MAQSATISLSANGLRQVPLHRYTNDFTFVVDSSRYECPRIVADFLSPRICQLHLLDFTADEFLIETKDPNHEFGNFLQLGHGRPIVVSDSARAFYNSICIELGNREIIYLLLSQFEGDLTMGNVIGRLKLLQEIGEDLTSVTEFISSHFSEFSTSDLSEIGVSVLHEVLSCRSLKMKDEDSLFSFISSQTSVNADYFSLLEFIAFEHLSNAAFERFIDLISASFEHFSLSLWSRLRNRLLLSNGTLTTGATRISAPYRDNLPFEGIISHLTKTFSGNVSILSVVDVTSSSGLYGWYHPRNAVDLYANTWFCSADRENSWLCYDFRDMTVIPTHYSIRFSAGTSYSNESRGRFLQNWIIEGSNDGTSWTELDQRTTTGDPQEQPQMETFAISSQSRVRMIRLRQPGKNAFGTNELALAAFEIFGEVAGTANPGILASMRVKAGQNIHDAGLVEITTSGRHYRDSPKQIVDYDSAACRFCTESSADSWICVHFMKGSIKPASYRFQTNYYLCPKHWVLEGSNDGISWIELDRRENMALAPESVTRFSVARSEEVRMIRIRQTGKNASGSDYPRL